MDKCRIREEWNKECPVTDCGDYAQYPLQDCILMRQMERDFDGAGQHCFVFGYVRETREGVPFVDLYVWDPGIRPQKYRRFVIREGYRLSGDDLKSFLTYAEKKDLFMGTMSMSCLRLDVGNRFPGWNIVRAFPSGAGEMLEHLYFASHRSGPLEILYKSGLDEIAYHIRKIPAARPEGKRPAEIIGHGVPLKLLRILNNPELVENLYNEKTMEECVAVYKLFAPYMEGTLPTEIQWNYLKDLYFNEGIHAAERFNRCLYKAMGDILIDFPVRQPLPVRNRQLHGFRRAPLMFNREAIIKDADKKIRERKRRDRYYEYENKDYKIILPENAADMFREADKQKNCLVQYISMHAERATTILFLRRVQRPGKSFVTMEVNCEQRITQIYCACNRDPDREVRKFVEEYAQEKGFHYEERDHMLEEIYDLAELFDDDWEQDEDIFDNGFDHGV
ncbi:hypothetical protein B5F29_02800 [Lachnoclostridium sp. An196]|uniref:PcfJ domain-containing protein n=1 Tax=Lachnoclostridium sp. An196 TaxID=1965583 RepID=UPI000B38DC85|nr:PcfJ domain-containing protein [Lachnoclostridium sp. An196]OUP21428.1 hypothetical protein B5F29_02800 [Lachnoclostridium sp. An196]